MHEECIRCRSSSLTSAVQLDVHCRHFILMQTHNSYRKLQNSTGSLNDCLKVIKHSKSTGEAVSLQTITKRVSGDGSE